MLSRTADSLYWMSRYIERAENTARMLEVNLQVMLHPRQGEGGRSSWQSVLEISELGEHFHEKYGEPTSRNVLEYMVRDRDNPSSIHACLRAARENARAVRGSLTTEVWETFNYTWLELQRQSFGNGLHTNPSAFFDWVKWRSHLSRGVIDGTMLRDSAYAFLGLGAYLERADNTARLLDVGFYHQPSQRGQGVEAALMQDFYHWSALLHSVSGFETYRKVYRDVVTPARVVEMLVLNRDMPRSLLSAVDAVNRYLAVVTDGDATETTCRALLLRTEVERARHGDTLEAGLHAFLTGFLTRINDLGDRISRDFLVPIA